MIPYREFTIDLVPSLLPPEPLLSASQYDNGRPVKVYVQYDGTDFPLGSGVTSKIQVRKPSGKVVIADAQVSTGTNVITFNLLTQMTAEYGLIPMELSLTGDGQEPIGTANWTAYIEKSPASGSPSDTWVQDIDEKVEQVVEAAEAAESSALDAEAWAVGQRNGEDVPDVDPTYENNAKYYALSSISAKEAAEAAASAAAESAGSAADSATDASGSAESASGSATAAAGSAAQAAGSATAAASSASAASTSAGAAAQSATESAGYATASENSAGVSAGAAEAAGQSAAAAAGSASTAATYASNASASATASAGSATQSANSATASATSAGQAAGSATAAAGSATEADASADRAQEILDSIPEDYSELSEDVANLSSAIDLSASGFADTYADKNSWYGGHITSSGSYDVSTSYMSISNTPLYASAETTVHVIPNGLIWTLRTFKKDGNNYTRLSTISNATDERTVVIPEGAYYSFDVNRGGGAMTPERNVCVFGVGNNVSSISVKLDKTAMIAEGVMPQSWFTNGGLTSGNLTNTKYRVSTTYIVDIDFDITIRVVSGWRFAINYFNSDNTFASDSGWITSEVVINAGQKFKLMIRREMEDTSETANIATFVASLTVIGGILNAFELPKSYTYAATGEKLSIQKTKYNIYATNKRPSALSVVGAASYQGVGYSNGVIFQFYKDNYVELIDYTTGQSIAILSAPTVHGNSVAFLDKYYQTGDEFPIALVSDSAAAPLAYMVRITRSAAALIDTISFPVARAGYYANAVFDVLNDIVYTVGYALSSYSTASDNHVIVAKWNFENLTINEDQTKTPEFLESFTLPFITTLQGMTFWNGKIYAVSSKVSSTAADTKVYIIDPSAKRIATVMQEFAVEISTHETEGFCFIDDEDQVTALIYTGGYNYRQIFFN